MLTQTNQIEMCKKYYKDEHDFQRAVGDIVMFLLQNDYIMTVRYDEKNLGIIIIQFETVNQDWGSPYPYWLEPEQADIIDTINQQ